MTYSFIDYRNSLSERNRQDIESKEWETAQEKVNEVVKGLLNQKDMRMAREIEGEMIDLLDSMYSIPDFAETKKIREDILRTVRENIELLRNSGFEDIAKEIEKEMEIDNERRELEAKMNALKERTDRLSSGDKTFEKCRKAVERVFDSSETPEHLEKGVMKLRDSYAIEDLQEARRQLGY